MTRPFFRYSFLILVVIFFGIVLLSTFVYSSQSQQKKDSSFIIEFQEPEEKGGERGKGGENHPSFVDDATKGQFQQPSNNELSSNNNQLQPPSSPPTPTSTPEQSSSLSPASSSSAQLNLVDLNEIAKAEKSASALSSTKKEGSDGSTEALMVEIEALLEEAEELRKPSKKHISDGEGAIEKYQKIIDIAEKAGDRSLASGALNGIGEIYLFGERESGADYYAAERYFNESSDFGNADAQHNLAFMYSIGVIRKDEGLAVLYDYFAATGGSVRAKLSLGYRHLNGYSVPKSCEAAQSYYSSAGEQVVKDLLSESGGNFVIERARLSDEKSRMAAPEEEEDVIQFYQHSADNGDVNAQVALGQLHLYGARGFEQNHDRAANYFRRAAASKDPMAMTNLAQLHLQGIGVEQNNETAFKLFKEAADAGNALAQNGLGYMYLHGVGCEKDVKLALKYFKQAADQGSAEAQFNLGAIYFSGAGVERKYSTALSYFTMAGHQGHPRALFNLAQMHLHGLGTVRSCNIGVKLMKTVAERGIWATQLGDAHRYFLKAKYETAFMIYARAAEEGHEVAQANSAWMLDNGLAMIDTTSTANPNSPWQLFQSIVQSFIHPSSSSSSSSSPSSPDESSPSTLTDVTDDGNTTSSQQSAHQLKIYQLAVRHYKLAAAQDNIDSLRVLGDYSYYGYLGKPDFSAAASYYSKAAEKGNAHSLFNLGFMHQFGLGLPQDFHLAKRFYDSALETSHEAYVPVKLALIALAAQQKWLQWTDQSVASSSSSSSATTTASVKHSWLDRFHSMSDAELWELVEEIENYLLLILAAILAILVYIRSQRR